MTSTTDTFENITLENSYNNLTFIACPLNFMQPSLWPRFKFLAYLRHAEYHKIETFHFLT